MPKFIVTNGSHFQPFTYDEFAKPLVQMAEAQNASQDAYDTLSLESEALRHYISDNPDDANAKMMYENYMAKLQSLQENLWNNGYTSQTRRDLAAARAGYASDITRLATAVKNRQERSKAYWDMKHAHPDMVMGSDPGLSGLDNYLSDDNYGQDYYNYSGDAFMQEVATDAKARAGEMLRDPKYAKDPNLVGYITKITQDGFTSQEVQGASEAVDRMLKSGNREELNKLPIGERILASVLLNHIDSTGAKGKVSEDEFQRLVDYGKKGLSQAIGKTEYKELSDKQWDFDKQVALANMKSSGKGGKDEEPPKETGYTWNGLIESLTSPGYEKLAKMTKKENRKYEDGPKGVVTPDGTTEWIDSPFAMSELIYNPQIRKDVRAKMGGLDVALPAEDFWGTTKSKQKVTINDKNGNPVTLVTGKLSDKDADRLGLEHGGVGLYYGKGQLHDEATRRFNGARKQYQEHVQSYKDANPNFDFDKLSITPDKERRMREEYNVDPRVDSSDIEALVTTKEIRGDYSYATLGGTDSSFDYARKNFAKSIINTFKHAKTNSGGKLDSGSRFAFYKVGEGGLRKSQKGETDITKVLGDKYGENSFLEIYMSPFNVAAGAGNGRPTFRFTTNTSDDSVWEADASMLGDLVWNALKQSRYPNGWSACDAVEYMMGPILHPGEVLSSDDSGSSMWAQVVMQMLNDTSRPITDINQINGPVIQTADGGLRYATAKDVVRSKQLQEELYNAVRDYIDKIISVPRDMNNKEHQQHAGDSGDKGEYYLPR